MRVLSLGWGVQSFTLAAMAALGEIEPVDIAIHADTTHEMTATYDFAKRWTEWLSDRGVRVVTVIQNNTDVVAKDGIMIPAHTESRGMSQRRCTYKWKISVIRQTIRKHEKKNVTQLLGISLDESRRMKNSDVKYIRNEYPLISKRMTRYGCKLWLQRYGLEIPPRSSCICCPLKSSGEWRFMKDFYPNDWRRAVEIDTFIRRHPWLPTFRDTNLYLNPQLKPLPECDFSTPQDNGQLELFETVSLYRGEK